MSRPVAIIALAAVGIASLHVHLSSAAFTAAPATGGTTLTIDQLSNHFSVTSGTDLQLGTTTPIATGDLSTLALAFGTVPKAQAFAAVFTVRNVGAQAATAQLTLSGVPQIASAVFASSGSTTAALAAGASTTVTVTTSSRVAGRGAGTLRLAVAGASWMYRDYPLTIAEAPEAPASLTATAAPAGRIHLVWAASATTTNLAGYAVYRAVGAGAYVRLNGTLATGTSYDDTSTVDGTAYTYKVEAVSSDAQSLASLDSPTASATADATAPTISVTYVDNKSPTQDQVVVTASAGASVSGTVNGNAFSGTGSFTANVGDHASGSGTGSATATDAAGNSTTVSFPWSAKK